MLPFRFIRLLLHLNGVDSGSHTQSGFGRLFSEPPSRSSANARKHRKHPIGGFGSRHVFCLCTYTKIHLFVSINEFKVIHRKSYAYNPFLFSYPFLCYRVYLQDYSAAYGSFPLSFTVFLRGVDLKILSCLPFRLSGSFKIPNLEFTISLINDTSTWLCIAEVCF